MKKHWPWFVLVPLVLVRLVLTFGSTPYMNGQILKVSGVLMTEPKYYSNVQLVTLSGFRFYLPLAPKVGYGDYISVSGELEDGELVNPKIVEYRKTTNPLFVIRRRILDFYKRGASGDESALISGMVLGSSELITKDFWTVLTKTGTAHVVVASGMNVAMVSGFLLTLLGGLVSRKKAVFISMFGVWFYVVFAGLNAPLVRAGVMGTLFLISQITGRQSHIVRLLILTALVMLLVRPDWLTDIGFLLTFGATLSLILFATKVDLLLHFVPKILRGDLSTSLAAQIFVAPILVLGFGYFNLLSPIVNMLVLWTVSMITVIGMLSGIVSLISQPIAGIILLLEYPLTSYFVFIVRLFVKSGLF